VTRALGRGPGGSRIAVLALACVVVAALTAGGLTAYAMASGSGHNPGRSGPLRAAPGVGRQPHVATPADALTPQQVRAAYNIGPLAAKGIDGAGQTIVLVDSFGSPTIRHDLAYFDRYFRLPAPPSFTVIQPAGRVPKFQAGSTNRDGWAAETTLDVEWAHAMAPGARIVLVETPTSENEGTTGFPQIVAAEEYVLRHHLGQVISQSFAATEQTFPRRSDYAALRRLRSAFELAARDHVTVLAASGDQGATSFTYNMQNLYTRAVVSWPATDPLVTAVGGTQLDLRANGTRRKADVAWSDSGGGRSVVFGRPGFQAGVASVTANQRGVPDISMDASCASSVAIYDSFAGTSWSPACGTSLAAPLFAGIVALADQMAGHGRAHGLGLLNPAIYKIAARHDRGIISVVKGTNTQTFRQGGKTYTVRGFAARAGYSLVTGVGTVNAAYFVPELAATAG
jgi:subtilase family serine protease